MDKIILNNENELEFEKLAIDLDLQSTGETKERCDPNCAPGCNPGCDPKCCPVCSPSCQPCFPFGKCNPELEYD